MLSSRSVCARVAAPASTSRPSSRLAATLAVLLSLSAACGSGDSDATEREGAQGQACYANDTCNAGLKCVKDRCTGDGKIISNGKDARADDDLSDGGARDAQAANTSDSAAAPDGASGTLGQACEVDSDCENSAWKCIAPAGFPTAKKYCAPSCEVADDCRDFEATSFHISVPLDPDGFGPNAWGTTLLERRTRCMPLTRNGTDKMCQFLCPPNAAANAAGTSCSCLPRHKTVKNAAGEFTECVWDDASECSIINYAGRSNRCDACNSQPLLPGCFTGLYVCGVNRNFNGTCYQGFSSADVQACLSSATFDCDPSCQESCAQSVSQDVSCTDLCCRESTRAPTVSPACMPGGGASDAGPTDAAVEGGGPEGGVPDAGPADAGREATAPDAATDCVTFTEALVSINLRSAAGTAPAASGGVVSEGVYRAVEGSVYGTGQTAGATVSTFAGLLRIQGLNIEDLHQGSVVTRFSGKGTSSLSGTSLAVTYTCASDGSKSASFPYAVLSTSSFRVQVPAAYPTWVTYTKLDAGN
jgi:hypothetical protein